MIWPTDDPHGTTAAEAAPCVACALPCDPDDLLCPECAEAADATLEAWERAEADAAAWTRKGAA